MPVEMRIWRIDGERPRPLSTAVLPTEAALEDFLEQDPSLLGTPLLVVGRQVRTPQGKYIDLLAIDIDGNLHVLELKRDKTPRDVVAQILDYGSWIDTLTREQVIDLASKHLLDSRHSTVPFEAAFAEVFGTPPPDELNTALELTIVATDLDGSSERIVTYLRGFGVPINAVFFSYLEVDDRRYLARSWLVTSECATLGSTAGGKKGKVADWNGRDWFVSFGGSLGRKWDDARAFGFVSAGGDAWYSRTLRSLPEGARIWVHLPGTGYVAVGTTLGEARRFTDAQVRVNDDWVPLAAQSLEGTYVYATADDLDDEETAEWVVPVQWIASRPATDAYWEKGMFANTNSACKLRQEFTLDRLATHFGVAGEDS